MTFRAIIVACAAIMAAAPCTGAMAPWHMPALKARGEYLD